MHNSRIVNNTVIDVNDVTPGPPWIMVTAHKDGTLSTDVIVRNNLATAYDLSGTNVTDDHNTTLQTSDLVQYFVNPATFDLHLLPTAPAVDTGSADQAPSIDADRIARPQGSAVDLGAFEWHDASVTPVDGGVGFGGTGSGGGGAAGAPGGGGASAGAPGGGGATAGAPGSTGGTPGSATSKDSSGCSCDLGRARPTHSWIVLAAAAFLRRRRCARRAPRVQELSRDHRKGQRARLPE
jgi:hypothetical protein